MDGSVCQEQAPQPGLRKPESPAASRVANLGQFPWILVMGEVRDSDVRLSALLGPSVFNQQVWHGQPAAKVSQGLFLRRDLGCFAV